MIRSLVLRVSALLASVAMALAFVSAPVHAASVTLSVAPCDSFTLTGTPPNQTLNCVVSSAPSGCSIQGPTSGTVGTPITLTTVCAQGVPNAWAWTGGHCQGVTTQSCTGTEGSVGNVTYNVVASNAFGPAPTASTTVSWTNTPPQAPSGCVLSANPSTLPATGGTTVLTVACSGGGPPTNYVWAGPVPASATTVPTQTSQPISQTTTFTVQPSNAGGQGNLATVIVTVGNAAVGFCDGAHIPGFTGTIPPSPTVATWGQAGSWQSSQAGNFGDGAVWVFKLAVPAGTPNSFVTGRFTVSEYQGAATPRQLTISTQPCDFRLKDYTGVNGPLAVSNGSTAEISYLVGAPFVFGPAGLIAGQTYYINVRNWQLDPSPQASCGQTSCNALMNDQPATP